MKRRDFLKILGIAPAVVAVPALAKSNNDNVFRIGDKPDGSKVLGGEYDIIYVYSDVIDYNKDLHNPNNYNKLKINSTCSFDGLEYAGPKIRKVFIY